MKARVAIQIGVSLHESKLLARAAALKGIALATWVREAALLMAKVNPTLTQAATVARARTVTTP